jgi:Tfp pilus assembly protein PilO
MKLLLIFLLVLVFLLGWMLYLAEQDAARWYGIAKQSESELNFYRDTSRIQTIALQNFCKPIELKQVKLKSPIRGR